MTKEHTPTPWDERVIEGIWLEGINKSFTDGKIGVEAIVAISSGTAKSDAAHIVKCVNIHDELVEALRSWVNAVDNDRSTFDSYLTAFKILKKTGAL